MIKYFKNKTFDKNAQEHLERAWRTKQIFATKTIPAPWLNEVQVLLDMIADEKSCTT